MKNILLLAAVIIGTTVFAQTTTTTETKTTVTKTTKPTVSSKQVMYYCSMCDGVMSNQAGKCPKCGMAMGKMASGTEAKYCCGKCDWTIPPVKGQCAESTQTIMKDGTLSCVYCHDKAGKCTKCGREMDKIEIKKKKDTKKG